MYRPIGSKKPPLPPNMNRDETWKYIYYICQSIRNGTAIPAHWAFLNKYADPKLVESMRKEVLLKTLKR